MDADKPTVPLDQAASALDRTTHAALARVSAGLSPVSVARAWTDWLFNLAASPGTQTRLSAHAQSLALQWLIRSLRSTVQLETADVDKPISPASDKGNESSGLRIADPRFDHEDWEQWPWSSMSEMNRAWEDWWLSATQLRGMEPHSREQLLFLGRQWLDMVSPSNFLWSNPQAIRKAVETRGHSLVAGAAHWWDEWRRQHGLDRVEREESLRPGNGLAMTKGRVVMRNDLIELIEYSPLTPKTHAVPVLLVPSCIMKYYILDLSPQNSMVRWLVEQGHTVFIVSWRNPDVNDALLTFDDYVRSGVLDAVEFVHGKTAEPVHLAGYCLGGTFASIAAAVEAKKAAEDGTAHRLQSLTLMAAETDFSEPGEMGVLIDAAQVELLEDMMAEQGFLTGKQMAGSFQFLHSRELVWSRRTQTMLLGEPPYSNDLMAWNADVTRLPAVMHSQYLRHMYLGNDLANDRYKFEGRTISLRNITVPVFVVGTEKDHVSPWRSVFKVHQLVDSDVTFVLANGGHNAGIVSEPGHRGRRYKIQSTERRAMRPTPDEWVEAAEQHEGSWWQAWNLWLVDRGTGEIVEARTPTADSDLGPAPGQYVMKRYAD